MVLTLTYIVGAKEALHKAQVNVGRKNNRGRL